MRKYYSQKIYTKLLFLIFGTSFLFFILYFSLYVYTLQEEKEVYKSTSLQYESEIETLFQLNSKTYITTIKDVTYWDDLYDFAKTKEIEWYNEFIKDEFNSYEVNYIGIYGIDNKIIIETVTPEIKSSNFISPQILENLLKTKVSRFYMPIPEGIVEVFGATIHPSDDPQKIKHKPSGYFIMARLLDKNYFKNLEKISVSKVELINSIEPYLIDTKELIVSEINLNNWNDEIVSKLFFERPFNLTFKSTKRILFIIVIAFVINILVYLYYAKKWIYEPLKNVTHILEDFNDDSINNLKKAPGEFGYIGNLFEENNNQKKQLIIAKQKAEESDKLKSSFLANLSHEIRTPMNAIVGFSDLLNDKNLSETNKSEYLAIIRNSGSNLVSIIEDLIEMSKIDANQISPKLISFDLNACIDVLYETLKVTIPIDKQIKLYIIENPNQLSKNIISDKVKLRQVVVNLITNAIKYTEKGKIGFGYRAIEEEEVIEFTIKDTGIGIEKRHLDVIFDRFRRVDEDFSAVLSGLGLGLPISKAYIEMLGGKINVESTIGVGSAFVFTIPLKYDNSNQGVIETDHGFDFEANINIVILVAEDDNINFLLIKKILELKNYTVIRAVNGQEAVDICAMNPDINLVFMDIKMPIMDGYVACDKIKTFLPNLPVIAQTAHSSLEDKERVMQAGFTDYITKPLDKEKIFTLIDRIFSK